MAICASWFLSGWYFTDSFRYCACQLQTPRFSSDISNRNTLISSLLEQSESSKASQCRPGRLEDCWAQAVEHRKKKKTLQSIHYTVTILTTSQRNSVFDSKFYLPSCSTESMPGCFDADRLQPGQGVQREWDNEIFMTQGKKCKRHRDTETLLPKEETYEDVRHFILRLESWTKNLSQDALTFDSSSWRFDKRHASKICWVSPNGEFHNEERWTLRLPHEEHQDFEFRGLATGQGTSVCVHNVTVYLLTLGWRELPYDFLHLHPSASMIHDIKSYAFTYLRARSPTAPFHLLSI